MGKVSAIAGRALSTVVSTASPHAASQAPRARVAHATKAVVKRIDQAQAQLFASGANLQASGRRGG